jgi:hypothetical protein
MDKTGIETLVKTNRWTMLTAFAVRQFTAVQRIGIPATLDCYSIAGLFVRLPGTAPRCRSAQCGSTDNNGMK